MNCSCGHPITEHDEGGCTCRVKTAHDNCYYDYCNCKKSLTELVDALIAKNTRLVENIIALLKGDSEAMAKAMEDAFPAEEKE